MATAEEKAGGSWQHKLEREGYAVLKGVLTKSEVDTARLVPFVHKRKEKHIFGATIQPVHARGLSIFD